jgi:phage shock protein PspC (stress-responsive transcriptional regulator)
MFQERIAGGKQVITLADVDYVIGIMGRPEQFADNAEETAPQAENGHRVRRLYRDPDDRVIGGVCSGFSHYLGIDPLWLRIAFAVAFFAFGSGLLLYILLMIIMPKAVTTAEKLEMKGEKVNLGNIRRSVQEEMDAIKSNYDSPGIKSGVARFFDALGQLVVGFLRLLGKLIAVFVILIGVIILFAFTMAFFALIGIGSVTVPFLVTDLVMEPWQQMLSFTGLFLLIGIPVIMLVYVAVKALFNIKKESRILNWTAFALWLVGVGLTIVVASSVGSEFRFRETDRNEITLSNVAADTLFIGLNGTKDRGYEWYIDDHHLDLPWSVTDNKDSIRLRDIRLDVVQATGAEFELVQVNTARGRSRKQAFENARALDYHFTADSSRITFDRDFLLGSGQKYRGHQVRLILKVPVGKSVFLGNDLEDFIYDIKNVTNTHDDNMLGKTWTMTPAGLECIGCNFPDNNRKWEDDVNIRINEKGISISGVSSESDSDFTIQGEDVKIRIDEQGVEIKGKKK